MNILRTSIVSGLLLFGCLPAEGQETREHPSLEQLVQAFVSRDQSVRTAVVGVCPEDSPYGDRLMLRLMEQEQTRRLVADLAAAWAYALKTCDDPRFGAWYRARFLEASDILYAQPLLSRLVRHPTQENVAVLKTVAFDPAGNEEFRSTILFLLHSGWSDEQKIDLFVETYRQPGAMPQPYMSTAQQNLVRGPRGDLFVERALDAVFRYPDQPDATSLLLNLTADVHWGVARDRLDLREKVMRGLDRAAQNRDGRLPPAMVQAARQQALEIREQRTP